MSRPEDLPRAASPFKKRAPSAPPEDEPDCTKDVDMLSPPPSNADDHDAPIGQGGAVEAVEDPIPDTDASSARDDVSTTAQVDDADEDLPSLTGLDMDRASVEEAQVGSDLEENGPLPSANNLGGNDAQEQEKVRGQGKIEEQHSGEGQDPTQTGSSATNTDEAADSDSKTVDTIATSTSVGGVAKKCKSSQPSFPLPV